MSKDTLFHDFFHNPKARGSYSGCNVSFRDDKFYSYSTVIGQKFQTKDKHPVLIYSRDRMSSTTGRHISYLYHACPYLQIGAPFTYGNSSGYTIKDVKSAFEDSISIYLNFPYRLERQSYREDKADLLGSYSMFCEAFKFKPFAKAEKLSEAIRLVNEKRNKPVDPVKAEKRRLAKERKQAKLLESVKGFTYMDKVRFYCDPKFSRGFDAAKKQEIRRSITQSIVSIITPLPGSFLSFTPSFIWLDGDVVRTSQRITIPAAIVKRAIETWRKKGIGHVNAVGGYSVDHATDDYIKIGCHYIPMQNITELEKELG
ncbi:MAG: hypothetical protein WC479_10180 [Candidatus Izemoplasmatales bacterium]